MFCSLFRDEASKSYHVYDCQSQLSKYRAGDTSDSFRIFLTLRAVYSKSLENHRASWLTTNSNTPGNFKSHFALTDMVTHKESNPCLEDDLKYHVLTALLILIVRQTTYLSDTPLKSDDEKLLLPLSEDELFLSEFINNMLRIQSYNTHPVLSIVSGEDAEKTGSIKLLSRD